MDVNPDTTAALALEAWLMARVAALLLIKPGLARNAAVAQALVEVRTRYPDLGGTVRRLDPKDIFE